MEWHRPFHELLERAVKAGYGTQSIAALTEILKEPRRAA